MEAEQALKSFLEKALVSKKERYIGFISTKITHNRFLNTIYHELESSLNASKKVEILPENVLAMPGYMFEPPGNFGEPIASLKEICDTPAESFLVVTIDGKYAIHGPETMIDSRAFYAV